ncbi:MAG: hypothetical protein DI537_13805 [Stutzerimonas stutzeri]|nr:MAG: hypothetical protein DI537_13805 [Stutzerimonas stutzeri]
MTLKYLKVASPNRLGYTGVLGRVMFKDGVSTEMVPQMIRDRMAAAMPFIEIDADGNEEPAGTLHRMRGGVTQRMLPSALERQSEADKEREKAADELRRFPTSKLETLESLQEIADKKGIAGVREIADRWGVKHRSINALIAMILDEQKKAIGQVVPVAETKAPETVPPATPEPELPLLDPTSEAMVEKIADALDKASDALDSIADAAATGNMSAALSADETLLGSSLFAATYEIKGETVQLGELVAAAQKTSGSTSEEWNALAQEDRDDLIRIELDRRLAE